MPIYVYSCADPAGGCGVRFERLLALDADAPPCPACGAATRKVPAGFSLGGRASAGLAKEQMPQTWRGLYNGDREYVTRMQRTWEKRQDLETRHPELAGDQRPILAHEGRYHDAPLRAGDVPATHGHGHGHGHTSDPASSPATSSPAAGTPAAGPPAASPAAASPLGESKPAAGGSTSTP